MIGPNSEKNDPLEEFEFRPINEGLGFHRKNVKSSPPTTMKSISTSTISAGSTSPFQTPLPRHDISKKPAFQVPHIEDDSIAKAQTAVNEILKNLNQKRQLDFVSDTERQKVLLKKSKPQLFAAILDGMLIIAAFLMTLILMLTITKVDMILNLTHPETSKLVYLATALLFAGVTFVYMVVNRSFLGYTPGEWAFDQQCGLNEEMNQLMYIPKVAVRTVIVIVTGFVVLPFLSYLFNKDMAGSISGVNLYKKPYGI